MKHPKVKLRDDDIDDLGISFSCRGHPCHTCSLDIDDVCVMTVLRQLRNGNSPPPESVADAFLKIADALRYGEEREDRYE